MGKKESLRVGVIGAGFMAKMHLAGLRRIAGSRLLPISIAGIAGLNHAAGEKLAAAHGCPYFRGGSRLLRAPGIDAVVIASPTHTHVRLAREAVAAGKAIFLEKPLGRNLAEAAQIARMLEACRRPHQIGLVLRFSPTYNVLKELLADPANGEFIACRFRDDQFFPIRSIYDSSWRGEVAKAGGGTLIEHSIHDVDVLLWFFGEAAVQNAIFAPSTSRGIEKLAALSLKFKRGGSAQLSSIWHHNLARENERHIEIFFENRFYHTLGGYTSPITVQGPKGAPRVIASREIERRYRAMQGWRDARNADFTNTIGYELYVFLKNALAGARKSAVPVAAGLAAHRIIESAYRMGKKR